jgi:hypothetical protein
MGSATRPGDGNYLRRLVIPHPPPASTTTTTMMRMISQILMPTASFVLTSWQPRPNTEVGPAPTRTRPDLFIKD